MGDQVGVELLYSSVKTKVKGVGCCSRVGDREDEMWLVKPHQAEGAWGPDELESREDADKMQ